MNFVKKYIILFQTGLKRNKRNKPETAELVD